MTSWTDYQDDISDAISDSMDVDWSASVGAKAVVAWLNEHRPIMADTPRVTVPVEPEGVSPFYSAAYDSIRKGAPGLSDATCAVIARSINMKVALLSAAPAPEGGAVPFDREGLIALIMEETTDDIVADGWDRLGKPNVLVQGCRYIRRNSPPSPEGYENPEASAKQFAGFIADRILKALATREEAPTEAGERSAISALFRDFGRCVPYASRYAFEKAANSHADAVLALRAQPPAREEAQPVAWTPWHGGENPVPGHMVHVLQVAGQTNASPMLSDHFGWSFSGLNEDIIGYRLAHPAPDALRVAVEALETSRENIIGWFEAIDAEIRVEHEMHISLKDDLDVIDQALAALQAEQKGGA